MPGFVKTPKDEVLWKAAKLAAKKDSKTQNFWALANKIFHDKKGKGAS